MVKRRKIKAMTIKYCKDKKRISLFNRKKENYENNIKDNTDLDQANYKYLL